MASKFLMITIFILDVIAFGLAVAAGQRTIKARISMDNDDECYDSNISRGYCLGAFLFLMASQLIMVIATKCFCFGKALKPGGSRVCAFLLFIICWVTFFIAEVCLYAGSESNADSSCDKVRNLLVAAGAAFTLFTAIISELYIVFHSYARGNISPYGEEAGLGGSL